MFLPPLPRPKGSFTPSLPPSHNRSLSHDRTLTDSSKQTSSPLQRFWRVHGKHSRISSQIDPRSYYQDTSIGSFHRKHDQLSKQLHHYQQLKIKYDSILSDRKRKADIVKELRTRFDVKFSRREVAVSSSTQLALAALSLVHEREKHKAATVITRAWRKWLIRRETAVLNVKKKSMARRIQHAWKRYLEYKKQKKELERKNKAAVKIQKLWKGWTVRKLVKEKITEERMRKNFAYFERVREKLVKESAEIIWTHWVKYKVRTNQKEKTVKLQAVPAEPVIEKVTEDTPIPQKSTSKCTEIRADAAPIPPPSSERRPNPVHSERKGSVAKSQNSRRS